MMARWLWAETGYSHRLCRSREAKAPKSNRARRKEEHPMKKQAIEKMYTEKVAELLKAFQSSPRLTMARRPRAETAQLLNRLGGRGKPAAQPHT